MNTPSTTRAQIEPKSNPQSVDLVEAIIDRLRDPNRDQRGDADLLVVGLEILRRRVE